MLDKKKLKAIELMCEGLHITDVSKEINVSRQTIYNWKKDEEFKAELDRVGQENLDATIRLARAKSYEAMKVTVDLMKHAGLEKTRLDAARDIRDVGIGKPTTKIQQISEDKKNNITNDDILSVIDSVDNSSNE